MSTAVRNITPYDYETILSWYSDRGQEMDASRFSRNGLLSCDCVAGFVYRDDTSKLAFLDGIVSDPLADGHKVARAIKLLIPALVARAVVLGATYVGGFTYHKQIAGFVARRLPAHVSSGFVLHGRPPPLRVFHGNVAK